MAIKGRQELLQASTSADEDDELRALAAEGKVRLAEAVMDESFWDLPAPRVSADALRHALNSEREEAYRGFHVRRAAQCGMRNEDAGSRRSNLRSGRTSRKTGPST